MRLKKIPNDADIIHCNSWYSFVFTNSGLPIVCTVLHWVHDPVLKPYKSFPQSCYHKLLIKTYESMGIKAAAEVTAISEHTSGQVSKSFPEINVTTVHTGIDTDHFKPEKLQNIDSEKFKLIFIGSPSARKGFDLLEKIMLLLGEDYVLYHTSGYIKNNGNVICTGRLSPDKLVELYNSVDAILFPSRYEGFGYAVAEGMACEKPAITTNSSALPELVDNNINGILCDVDDIQSFVREITALKQDRDKLNTFGKLARQKILDNFTMEKMISKYIEIYKNV